jgi:4-hydroxy-tetrahydrodipicolinate synthase
MPMKRGSTCALITPFDPTTGAIDVAGLRSLLQYHLDACTHNLCILGTTGEANALSMQERAQVLTIAVEMVKGRIPILAGCGTINMESVKAMTQQAIDVGCDANLIVTPYYVKPPQRSLIQHFTTVADYGLPVIIYNVPGRTAVNFLDESIAVAAQHPGVIGVKDATGDLSRITNLRKLVADDFLIYSGDDSTSKDFLLLGGDGTISVTANIAAQPMSAMVTAALAGQAEEATRINDQLDILHKKLFVESNPIPTKWAAMRLGMIQSAYCRPPLDALDTKLESIVEDALQQAGLLKK